jgi:hypothetical protein
MALIQVRSPLMRISLTTSRIPGSLGLSVRRHRRSLPSRLTW